MTWIVIRSLTLQLITLCAAIGVLWAPVSEAAECGGEPVALSQFEQHGESGKKERGPEKHGTCAHGHCHHASQAVRASGDTVEALIAKGPLGGVTSPALAPSINELATPPPRC